MIGAERPGLRARNVRDTSHEAPASFVQSPIAKAVRSLDAYPKVQEDYVTGSTEGGIITFVCALVCALLFLSEYAHHRTTIITSEVKVDTMSVDRVTPMAERLRVHIDVTFHALACELITLDTQDQAGEEHHDVHEGHLKKRRLDRHGRPIDAGYTVDPVNKHAEIHREVRRMRKDAKGDEGHGGHTASGHDGRGEADHLPLARGDGAAAGGERGDANAGGGAGDDGSGGSDSGSGGGSVGGHVGREGRRGRALLEGTNGVAQQEMMPLRMMNMFNLQDILDAQFPDGVEKAFRNEAKEGCEVIGYIEVNRVPGTFSISPGRSLQIGMQHVQLNVRTELNMTHTINKFAFGEAFPGFVSPLDGDRRDLPSNCVHQYFLKVVPTSFTPLAGPTISSQQYSVTESTARAQGLIGGARPSGVYFHYELSPMRVDYREERNTFGEFLTGVCAVVGGVATVSGLVHKAVLFARSKARSAA